MVSTEVVSLENSWFIAHTLKWPSALVCLATFIIFFLFKLDNNLKCKVCFPFVSMQTGAVKKLLRHTAEMTGAVLQEESITFPLTSKEQVKLS